MDRGNIYSCVCVSDKRGIRGQWRIQNISVRRRSGVTVIVLSFGILQLKPYSSKEPILYC